MKKKVKGKTRLPKKPGMAKRRGKHFEEELEVPKVGELLLEARKHKSITQEELARRIGTTKHYISRVEHGGTDLRVSTLLRIVQIGLEGTVRFSIDG